MSTNPITPVRLFGAIVLVAGPGSSRPVAVVVGMRDLLAFSPRPRDSETGGFRCQSIDAVSAAAESGRRNCASARPARCGFALPAISCSAPPALLRIVLAVSTRLSSYQAEAFWADEESRMVGITTAAADQPDVTSAVAEPIDSRHRNKDDKTPSPRQRADALSPSHGASGRIHADTRPKSGQPWGRQARQLPRVIQALNSDGMELHCYRKQR